jgi:cyclohexanone monooxygenase
MCKRPCFHDEYLDTYNRSNVVLVDTQGRGVERFTETAAIVGGKEYELDCLVFATGFEYSTDYARRTGYEIYGRGGVSLSEKWREGVSTLYGVQTYGFPNCLIISTFQQATTANFTHMFDESSTHIAYIVSRCLKEGIRQIEPSQAAEEDWVDQVMVFAEERRKFDEECTPGFYNNEGMPTTLSIRNASYAGGAPRFMNILRSWRAEGSMKGLERITG